jgi:hypothetical protein
MTNAVDTPAGATVFVDACVFIHHFEPNAVFGPVGTEFLERSENHEFRMARRGAMIRGNGPAIEDRRRRSAVALRRVPSACLPCRNTCRFSCLIG